MEPPTSAGLRFAGAGSIQGPKLQTFQDAEAALLKLAASYEHAAAGKRHAKPVVYCCSRLKSAESARQKCRIHGWDPSFQQAEEHLFDLVGVRVVCSFASDVYDFVRWLRTQQSIEIVNEKDYQAHPKESGYRSYHIQLKMPQGIKAEIQVRTIAADFWAALEHQIRYKKNIPNDELLRKELRLCAGQ